jgi:hypothetical protein
MTRKVRSQLSVVRSRHDLQLTIDYGLPALTPGFSGATAYIALLWPPFPFPTIEGRLKFPETVRADDV